MIIIYPWKSTWITRCLFSDLSFHWLGDSMQRQELGHFETYHELIIVHVCIFGNVTNKVIHMSPRFVFVSLNERVEFDRSVHKGNCVANVDSVSLVNFSCHRLFVTIDFIEKYTSTFGFNGSIGQLPKCNGYTYGHTGIRSSFTIWTSCTFDMVPSHIDYLVSDIWQLARNGVHLLNCHWIYLKNI